MDTTVLLTTENFVSVDPADLFPSPIDPRDEHASGAVEKPQGRERLHVIVGCCLADLLSPSALLGALKRLAGGGAGDCLVYLPITFAGKTEAIPAAPQARDNCMFSFSWSLGEGRRAFLLLTLPQFCVVRTSFFVCLYSEYYLFSSP